MMTYQLYSDKSSLNNHPLHFIIPKNFTHSNSMISFYSNHSYFISNYQYHNPFLNHLHSMIQTQISQYQNQHNSHYFDSIIYILTTKIFMYELHTLDELVS